MKAAVLGSPVAHSLSPILHNAAYEELGLDHTYSAVEVLEVQLGDFLRDLDFSWLGVSLTMPLKEVAFEFAESCDEYAKLSGAINTLVFRDGVQAFNTDVLGMFDSFVEHGVTGIETGVIFGSGATARSALVAMQLLGADSVNVVARNRQDLEVMKTLAINLGVELEVSAIHESNWMSADAVINTTPVGVLDQIASTVYRPRGVLLDVVYNPWPTSLAAAWAVTGGSITSGLSMLLHQAGHQVSLMTNQTPPLDHMRTKLNLELLARGLATI